MISISAATQVVVWNILSTTPPDRLPPTWFPPLRERVCPTCLCDEAALIAALMELDTVHFSPPPETRWMTFISVVETTNRIMFTLNSVE